MASARLRWWTETTGSPASGGRGHPVRLPVAHGRQTALLQRAVAGAAESCATFHRL